MALNYSASTFDPTPGSTMHDSARATLGFHKMPGYVNAYTHPVSPFILASCTSELNLLAYPMVLVYQPIGRNVYVMSRDIFLELIRTRTLPIKFVPAIQDDQIAFAATTRIARVCVNSMVGGGAEHWISAPVGHNVYDEAYLLNRYANIYATCVDNVTGNTRIDLGEAEVIAFGCLTQMDTGVVAHQAADTNGYRAYGMLSCKRLYSEVVAVFDDIATRFLSVHTDHPAIATVRSRVAALRAATVAVWGSERTYQGPELSALANGTSNPQWTFRMTVPRVKRLGNPGIEGWESAGPYSAGGSTRAPDLSPPESEARMRQYFTESGCVGLLLHDRAQTATSTIRTSDGLKLAPFAVDFADDTAEKFEVLSVLGSVDPLLGLLAGGLEHAERRYAGVGGPAAAISSYRAPTGAPDVAFLKNYPLRGNFEHAVIVKSFVNQLMWAVESTD